jgi:hypothetical protein
MIYSKPVASLLLALCLYCSHASAQDNPGVDYAKIEKESKDASSPFYFRKLYKRFLAADSTMTKEERKYFYFGYSYAPESKDFKTDDDPAREALKKLLQKDSLTDADARKLIDVTSTLLKSNPVSIRMLNYQGYAADKIGDIKLADIDNIKISIISDAIFNTGDGKTVATAFHVISIPDEYDILQLLGFKSASQSLVEGHYDYLELEENQYGIKGIYFNCYRSMAALEELLKGSNTDMFKPKKE